MPNCQNNTGNQKVHKAWTDHGENSKDATILMGQKIKRIITISSAGNNQSDSNSWGKRALIATPAQWQSDFSIWMIRHEKANNAFREHPGVRCYGKNQVACGGGQKYPCICVFMYVRIFTCGVVYVSECPPIWVYRYVSDHQTMRGWPFQHQ